MTNAELAALLAARDPNAQVAIATAAGLVAVRQVRQTRARPAVGSEAASVEFVERAGRKEDLAVVVLSASIAPEA